MLMEREKKKELSFFLNTVLLKVEKRKSRVFKSLVYI